MVIKPNKAHALFLHRVPECIRQQRKHQRTATAPLCSYYQATVLTLHPEKLTLNTWE